MALCPLLQLADAANMKHDRDQELLSRFWEFHAALVRRDGLEDRIRAGDLDPSLLERSLPAAEAVIAARSRMYRCLMRQGWSPPPSIVQDLAYDDTVLSQWSGAVQD